MEVTFLIIAQKSIFKTLIHLNDLFLTLFYYKLRKTPEEWKTQQLLSSNCYARDAGSVLLTSVKNAFSKDLLT
jgi:hypothetical protein